MEREYKVLVIMPAFNAARFLKESVPSILNQKKVNVDLVVVDDASTDDSFKILDEFPKVRKFRNRTNMGTYYSINVGLYNSLGDSTWTHFCIHGADDISDPMRMSNQLSQFNSKVLAVSCNSVRIDFKTKRRLRINATATESQLIYKREVFELLGYFDSSTRFGADTEYQNRLKLAFQNKIKKINQILVTGYQHGSNLTQRIKLNGPERKKYVARFNLKHKKMKSSNSFFQDFKP